MHKWRQREKDDLELLHKKTTDQHGRGYDKQNANGHACEFQLEVPGIQPSGPAKFIDG